MSQINMINTKDLRKLPHRKQVEFALFCAKQTVKCMNNNIKKETLNAIKVTELWLEGKASSEECAVACRNTTTAYVSVFVVRAIMYTAQADYYAMRAADYATLFSELEEAIKEQWEYYLT